MTDKLILELERRAGLPDDLALSRGKISARDWQAHANIHGMANMWLQRHDMFRELGGILTGAIADYREGRTTAPEFAKFFAPRLNFFLGNLDGHHNVEDQHYFPVFARAETRLKRGFEILDLDHHTIHDGAGAQRGDGECLPRSAAGRMRTSSVSPPTPMPTPNAARRHADAASRR